MENNTYVIVNVNTRFNKVYRFCNEQSEEQDLEEAKKQQQEQAIHYKRLMELSNSKSEKRCWEHNLKKCKKRRFELMTWEEFRQRQTELLLLEPAIEISKEQYLKAIKNLPAKSRQRKIDDVEMAFDYSQGYAGLLPMQYARKGNKYYKCYVDGINKATWIHNKI